jgi:hypothetical protein
MREVMAYSFFRMEMEVQNSGCIKLVDAFMQEVCVYLRLDLEGII